MLCEIEKQPGGNWTCLGCIIFELGGETLADDDVDDEDSSVDFLLSLCIDGFCPKFWLELFNG